MARDYGRVQKSIWWDERFRALSTKARVAVFYMLTCATWGPDPVEEIANGAGMRRGDALSALKELEVFFLVSGTQEDFKLTGLAPYGCLPSPDQTGRLPWYSWRRLRLAVFERDSHTCRYCGAVNVALECDHVTPISRGGSNELSNLATACRPCNRSKWDKTLEEWLTA